MDDNLPAEPLEDADLRRLISTLQPEDAERLPVPADLWSRIDAGLSAAGPPVLDGGAQQATLVADPRDDAGKSAVVTPLRRRRTVGIATVLALAASVALALWVMARPDGQPRELASVQLSNEGLATFPVVPSGSARLVDEGGRLLLEVDLENVPAVEDGYIEVWLIDRNVQGMVSLGPYHGRGRYEVPAGVDPANFPVVDVSDEPADGQPTHSGRSIVRGVLPL